MKTKKIFISLILLFFFVSTLNAQNSLLANRAKTDSLKQLIDAYNKEDKKKVHLLNEYARQCFYNYEIKKGFIATRDARILSVKLDFEGGKIMYYLTLASYFSDDNMNEYYQKQAQWLSNSPDKQLGKYYVDLRKIDYDFRTNYKELINEYTLVYDYFEKLGDKEIQACLLYRITGFNYELDNLEEILRLEDKGIGLYTDLGQLYPVFLITTYKMGVLNSLGRTEEAKIIEIDLIEFVSKNANSNAIGLIALSMGTEYSRSGRNALAIEYYLKSIPAFERTGDLNMLAETYNQMGRSYELMEMYDKATEVYLKHISLIEKQGNAKTLYEAYNKVVMPLFNMKKHEDARKYMAMALQDTNEQNQILFQGRNNSLEGQILKDSHQYTEAIPYFQNAYRGYLEINKMSSAPFMPMYMAECYYNLKNYNAALENALQSLKEENALNYARTKVKRKLRLLLSEIYDAMGQKQKAFENLKIHQKIRSESDRLDEANRIANTEVRIILEKSQTEIDLLEKQKKQKAQESKTQRLWIFSITGALLSLLFLTLILFRNNKTKQKANALLREQKEEIQSTLEQLEATQSQLIQSEKMASLGELTAGIAHEIQNPLNFVNNFAEVSKELIGEMNEELEKGDINEAKKIGKDIDNNLEKINHHGKRAEAIVKGMLQHSRTNSGEKELTDINALADEYLRLSYHGLRAKDKSFNADFKTEFDESLPKINVVPQDIGRVLLNLINNAFYAVDKRAKELTPQPPEGGLRNSQTEYKPVVTVSTASFIPPSGGMRGVKISVTDNGPGIPPAIKDKIFQPFFTTKPTGQGTGLGLSLSYDIVKAHGGEISVKSNVGNGTEFLIQLPIK